MPVLTYAELNRSLLAALPHSSSPPGVPHVPQTHLRHVQPLGLHAHLGHILPDANTADRLYRAISLVEFACSTDIGSTVMFVLI